MASRNGEPKTRHHNDKEQEADIRRSNDPGLLGLGLLLNAKRKLEYIPMTEHGARFPIVKTLENISFKILRTLFQLHIC